MANTKSAQKALRSSAAKREINNSRKSRIKTFIRKVDDAIKSGDKIKAGEAFKALEPEIMRGVTKKVYRLNTAARKLTRISAAIRKIKA
jgi:small subunit ribosomal protein S20